MKITKDKFVEIIETNQVRLRHLCRVYAQYKEQQKDMYQEIVLQIWKSLPSFNGEAKINTWVYRVALNTAVSISRQAQTRRKYYAAFRTENQTDIHGDTSVDEEDEKVQALYEAISVFKSPEKAIINMYLEGFSYAEIAYVTGITENYVGVKINRIKKKLSNLMDDSHEA